MDRGLWRLTPDQCFARSLDPSLSHSRILWRELSLPPESAQASTDVHLTSSRSSRVVAHIADVGTFPPGERSHRRGVLRVGHFSIVKRVTFPLSRCDTTCQGGSLLGCHVGHFLLDVHTLGKARHRCVCSLAAVFSLPYPNDMLLDGEIVPAYSRHRSCHYRHRFGPYLFGGRTAERQDPWTGMAVHPMGSDVATGRSRAATGAPAAEPGLNQLAGLYNRPGTAGIFRQRHGQDPG
jgi:hypothetical protein